MMAEHRTFVQTPCHCVPGLSGATQSAEVTVEFVLPSELRSSSEARAHCSQQIEAILNDEVATGQHGRLLIEHAPRASERRYRLSLFVPERAGECVMAEAAHTVGRLLRSMIKRGFAARSLSEAECVELHSTFPSAGKDVHHLTLKCGPETTHPQITSALQEALDDDRYLYVLDFKRLGNRDPITRGAQCAYGISLVLPRSTQSTVQRAKTAIFEMDGALAAVLSKPRSTDRLDVLKPFSGRAHVPHVGSIYTVADLIPA